MKYIYHHLGLGDHIICNGLVRYFNKKFGHVSVFTKEINIDNVKYMYRDNKEIDCVAVNSDADVENFILNDKNIDLIKVGFDKLHNISHETFDEGFYKCVDLPFLFRYDYFHYKRNFFKEKEIYDELNPDDEKYIFIHGIDLKKVRDDLKIIDNPVHHNIFDLIYLIENAEEVHLMESSIKCLVNSFKMEKPKFFYHQYARGYSEYHNTKGLNFFEIIN